MVEFRSDMTVELVDCMGSDVSIARSAWVSTMGERAEEGNPERVEGLINFLVRERHGCYDSQTEVLTSDGWKFWPTVDGTEQFLTLNLTTDQIEYQSAERVIHKTVNEPMIQVQMSSVDVLVTQDHKMVASSLDSSQGRSAWSPYDLVTATSLLEKSHRVRLGGGEWQGEWHIPELAALVGFITADGHVKKTSIEFNLRKDRKIEFLYSLWEHISTSGDGRYRLLSASDQLRSLAESTYTVTGDRCFPRDILQYGDAETIIAMLEGYLQGDGSVSAFGRVTCSTVSSQLVDDIQEAAVKAGMSAIQGRSDVDRRGAYGTRPLHRLTIIYRKRNTQPRIGWTRESREAQVSLVPYSGEVHCVTVPNGTLYVRRNGKPMWSGNSPLESGVMQFRTTAPIFVFREHHRHRIASYNELSGRYAELKPVFYVPDSRRKLIQTGKVGHYQFSEGDIGQYVAATEMIMENSEDSYKKYENLLAAGIAKEVSRMVLPVNIYSTCYVTINLRSLMNFLSLRRVTDDTTVPTHPQHEIEMVAEQYEQYFANEFPMVHKAFVKNGRVGP